MQAKKMVRNMKIDKTALENYNNGCTFLENKEYDNAVTAFSAAIGYQFDYIDAYKKRAIARKLSGDLEGALRDYGFIVAFEPDDAVAYNNMGNIYFKLSYYENAVEAYLQALSIDSNFDLAIKNKNIAEKYLNKNYYLEKGIKLLDDKTDYKTAIAYFNRAIELDKENSLSYEYRGKCYFALSEDNNYEQATKYLELAINDLSKAYELAPDSEEIKNFLYAFSISNEYIQFESYIESVQLAYKNNNLSSIDFAKIVATTQIILNFMQNYFSEISDNQLISIYELIVNESIEKYEQTLNSCKVNNEWLLDTLYGYIKCNPQELITAKLIILPLCKCLDKTLKNMTKHTENLDVQAIIPMIQKFEYYSEMYNFLEAILSSTDEVKKYLEILKPTIEIIKSTLSNNDLKSIMAKYGKVNTDNFAPIKKSSQKRKVDI